MHVSRITKAGFFAAISAWFILAPANTAEAQVVESHPIENLGDSIEVSGYPVGDGHPHTFQNRREEAIDAAINDVKAAYGEPVLTETVRSTHVLLSYPDKLVAITGQYSNSIICRIEIDTSALRMGFVVDQTVSLAARSCRKAEEDGWGGLGLPRLSPIGTSDIPELHGVQASVYATDMHSEVFRRLVREFEVLNSSRASLVRDRSGRGNSFQREGEILWQYAWFENGDLLLQFYRKPNYSRRRRERGLACAIVLNPSESNSRAIEAFSNWCDSQSERLLPELDAFFAAVHEFRLNTDRSDEPSAIATDSGFHSGEFPVELTARYWATGEVVVQ